MITWKELNAVSAWGEVWTPEQLDAYYKLTAELDPSYAARERKTMESVTNQTLRQWAADAWINNNRSSYILCRSHLAARGAVWQ